MPRWKYRNNRIAQRLAGSPTAGLQGSASLTVDFEHGNLATTNLRFAWRLLEKSAAEDRRGIFVSRQETNCGAKNRRADPADLLRQLLGARRISLPLGRRVFAGSAGQRDHADRDASGEAGTGKAGGEDPRAWPDPLILS
jgi:hypothetical protein